MTSVTLTHSGPTMRLSSKKNSSTALVGISLAYSDIRGPQRVNLNDLDCNSKSAAQLFCFLSLNNAEV